MSGGAAMRWARSLLGMAVLGLGCLGDRGPQGPEGPAGPTGPAGDAGVSPCVKIDGGTAGIADVALGVSSPINGQFFTAGEKPVVTVKVSGAGCDRLLLPAEVGTENLYVAGPRRTLAVRTASTLLNAVTDRNAADNQHHFV